MMKSVMAAITIILPIVTNVSQDKKNTAISKIFLRYTILFLVGVCGCTSRVRESGEEQKIELVLYAFSTPAHTLVFLSLSISHSRAFI